MSGCPALVNMTLGGIGHTHTQTRFSNFGPKCGALNGHQPRNKPGTIGKLSLHRWAWRQKPSARSVRGQLDCGPDEVGKWVSVGVSTAGARWAGAEMGALAVCSARSGCLRRGVVHGDGKGSAGHVGVGLGWQTGKLNFTHGPAALISYSSTSSRKSRV